MPEFAIIAELTVAYKLNDIISAVGHLKTVSILYLKLHFLHIL